MTVLLLAGTGDAKRIAWGLADTGVNVIASLAGATRNPEPLPVPTRVGGFGGEDGFRAYIAAEGITSVLDATHPFAEAISNRTAPRAGCRPYSARCNSVPCNGASNAGALRKPRRSPCAGTCD